VSNPGAADIISLHPREKQMYSFMSGRADDLRRRTWKIKNVRGPPADSPAGEVSCRQSDVPILIKPAELSLIIHLLASSGHCVVASTCAHACVFVCVQLMGFMLQQALGLSRISLFLACFVFVDYFPTHVVQVVTLN